jgi:predicted component of type VI protein secretion system
MLRLTERFIAHNQQDDSMRKDEIMDLPNSVCGFIRKILNTREGSVLINPKLGTPAFDVSRGLVDEEDKKIFLIYINQQIKLAEHRVSKVSSQLKNDKNIAVVMAFKLVVETVTGQNITMVGRLQSDCTFDVELA